MRAIRAVVALACCAYVTGCGVPQARPAASSPSTGAVAGHVLRPPGIDPRSGGGASKAPVPVNADPVEAHDARGRTVGRAVTAAGGRFDMVLAPGAYRIVEGVCGVSTRVAVRGGATTSVTLTIPNSC